MVHLWGSRAKEETEMSKSALGEDTRGDIAVVICGEKLDFNLVYLGCQMAKGAKRKVHLVHVIEVPRALPLKAVLTQESERADKLLNSAMVIAEKVGCDAVAEVVQARDAGPAIVDEAKDHHCALILIGLVRNSDKTQYDLGKTVPFVLANATCRVWLVQDPAPQPVMVG
ncbi:universal stress protein [Ktedonosporobacter rubrisoli]|uniref:Universal stress protein n=2 Tax=Ktedonosporobacter rubrisoli TaxID=2509675 RepID=A0A4P6JUF4_KTERU|nr:universal stress protein [Ktedonosporobacter rubrisoli]